MPFRKTKQIFAVVDGETTMGTCCNDEISKQWRRKEHRRNTSSGSLTKSVGVSFKMHLRRRSTSDLKCNSLNVNIDDLPPLKPLRGCRSNGSLSSLSMMGNEICEQEKSMKRSVSFGNLTIREHPRTLGGMASSGPLLTLDWYDDGEPSSDCGIQCKTIEVQLEDYENTREPRRPRPPLVSSAKRERLLKKFGVTDDELLDAEKKLNMEKQNSKNDDGNFLDVMGKAVRKTLKVGSNDVQKELDVLMARSAKAEQVRKLQMEKYLYEQRMQILASCEAQIMSEQLKLCCPQGRRNSVNTVKSDATNSTESSSMSVMFEQALHNSDEFALEF